MHSTLISVTDITDIRPIVIIEWIFTKNQVDGFMKVSAEYLPENVFKQNVTPISD